MSEPAGTTSATSIGKRGAGLGGLDACPGCGSTDLRAAFDGEWTNFFCESCGFCWLVTMGWVKHVDPLTCPGCERRAECLARLAARGDHGTDTRDSR